MLICQLKNNIVLGAVSYIMYISEILQEYLRSPEFYLFDKKLLCFNQHAISDLPNEYVVSQGHPLFSSLSI